ncbi:MULTISPECIES: hypothetical protein [unclassified Sphingomonas]|uniref:hypothetical protein n=1 Tax=unclassified Sphingomonas TaxID=196159 RepID=UPI0007002C76|nr:MULTISPECIES: hypothetical protein [unclassified Sphingomonas]KQX23321.1 hypothetical protein ASD17_03125 [Sphingomonas sp. Root1294]KQY68169.1 hypothetical protein ASD39_05645 [Sphingomonas sp. Root50]KRB91062.1 hypothetical protein ASE22_12440 [Sphingomonas sp. Root720]
MLVEQGADVRWRLRGGGDVDDLLALDDAIADAVSVLDGDDLHGGFFLVPLLRRANAPKKHR